MVNEKVRQMVYMAAYDLDRFKQFVFSSRFLVLFDLAEEFKEQVRVDDTDLLKLGLDWINFGLFGAKTLKVKPEVLEAKKRGRPGPGVGRPS